MENSILNFSVKNNCLKTEIAKLKQSVCEKQKLFCLCKSKIQNEIGSKLDGCSSWPGAANHLSLEYSKF